MERISKKYIIIGIVTLLLLSLGVTFAYWTARIKGEGSPMTFKAANLKITFTDSAALSANPIEPGWSSTKTFSVTNESDIEYEYNIILKDLINTFKTDGYLQYKITSSNGYNMTDYLDIPKSETASDKVIASSVTIGPNKTQNYTIEFIYKNTEEDQSADMGATLSGSLAITEANKTLYEQLLADHPTVLTRNDFSTVFTDENTKTLYKVNGNWTENGKDVYYFAGNAQDNWVKFGSDSNGNDLYWRIIRTNEDGSVRLLYVGDSMNTTTGYINASQTYNGTYNNPMYVGYMYGSSGSLTSNRTNTTSSLIKTTIDTWYNGSLNAKTDAAGNKYDKYVSRTAIYCNDRAHEGTYTTGNTVFYYAGYYRLQSGKQPSYKCGNNVSGTLYGNSDNADRFSASTSTTYTNGVNAGNGKLQYPLALMTADEVAFAGGLWATNAPTWYYYNSTGGSVVRDKAWWTMSPYDWVGSHVRVFFVHGSSFPGRLSTDGVSGTNAVRPVLSLKSCTSWVSGDGSVNNPYEVTIDNTCASREN